jgi:hypothetical protein
MSALIEKQSQKQCDHPGWQLVFGKNGSQTSFEVGAARHNNAELQQKRVNLIARAYALLY